jgi:hypothetical protein
VSCIRLKNRIAMGMAKASSKVHNNKVISGTGWETLNRRRRGAQRIHFYRVEKVPRLKVESEGKLRKIPTQGKR